jgi:hypothetical protein
MNIKTLNTATFESELHTKVIRRAIPRNNFKRCLFYLHFIAVKK